MIRPIGLDLGNAEMNLVGPVAGSRIAIPHAVVDAASIERPQDFVSSKADPIANLHAHLISPALSGAQTLIVGELATREYAQEVEERAEGEVKAESPRHLALALIGLAAAAFRSWPGDQTARLAVSVALPLAEVKNAARRQGLQKALRQEHQVEWLSTPGWAGRKLVLSIADVDIVPEAAAAFLALANRHPELQRQQVMVVDVGAGSLDWATFFNGQFQLGLSDGTAEGGIAAAADRILAAAHAEYGPHVGRHRTGVLHSLRAGALDGTRRYYLPSGNVGKVEVTREATRELGHLAKQIGRHVKQAVRAAGNVDRLFLVGGGGALIAPYLASQVPDLAFEVAPGAEWANAEGLFLRAADRIARGIAQ